MGGREQFEHKMHGGGLNNSEKQRGKNAAMVQRSRKIRDKTQSSKQGRRGTNAPKRALTHDAKKDCASRTVKDAAHHAAFPKPPKMKLLT